MADNLEKEERDEMKGSKYIFENPWHFTMPNKTLSITPIVAGPDEWILRVETNDPEHSTVSQDGCAVKKNKDSVTIACIPSEGYQFDGWYDEQNHLVSDIYSIKYQPTRDTTLTAHVSLTPVQYLVGVSEEGCFVEGGGYYNAGDTCTLTATLTEPSFIFRGYYDKDSGRLLSSNMAYSFTVTTDVNTQAVASKANTFGLEVQGDSYGAATVTVTGAEPKGENEYEMKEGVTCKLLCTTTSGYNFAGWTNSKSSELLSTDNPYEFNPTDALTVKVITVPSGTTVYPVSVNIAPSGSENTVSGTGVFPFKESVSLTATPANGYIFVQWSNIPSSISGDISDVTKESITFSMPEEAITLTAEFTMLMEHDVSTTKLPEGCSVDGLGHYYQGDIVTLEANSKSSYVFDNWGDIPSSISDFEDLDTKCKFTMPSSDVVLSPVFTQK